MDLFVHVIGDLEGRHSSEDLQIDRRASKDVLAETLNEIQFEGGGTKVPFDSRTKDQRTDGPPEQARD